ncbi:MAG: trimethylamine methyltransferase family protein [Actinomycetota bacterium]
MSTCLGGRSLGPPDFATWEGSGSPDAGQRAFGSWRGLLDAYEDPGIDGAIDEELRAHVERHKQDPPEPED